MNKMLDNRFKTVLSKLHVTYLKPAGFKKTGSNFRIYLPNGLYKIINFQRSMFNGCGECRFTMNLGIYFEKDWENPNLRFKEYQCAIRARISTISEKYTCDQWWDITEDSNDEMLYAELASVITEDVLPWMDQFSSLEATIRLGQTGNLRGHIWKPLC